MSGKTMAVPMIVLAAGCSFLFVARPPDTPERRCTEDPSLPGLDLAAGVLLTLGGVGLAIIGGVVSADTHSNGVTLAGVGMLGLGLAFDVSGGSGLAATSQCRRQHQPRPVEMEEQD